MRDGCEAGHRSALCIQNFGIVYASKISFHRRKIGWVVVLREQFAHNNVNLPLLNVRLPIFNLLHDLAKRQNLKVTDIQRLLAPNL